jgi:hypothetical protein
LARSTAIVVDCMGDSSFAEHSATQGDSGTSMPMRVAGGVHLINAAVRPPLVVRARLEPAAGLPSVVALSASHWAAGRCTVARRRAAADARAVRRQGRG